jgi:hypothetical protein
VTEYIYTVVGSERLEEERQIDGFELRRRPRQGPIRRNDIYISGNNTGINTNNPINRDQATEIGPVLPRFNNDTIINLTYLDYIPLKRLLPKFGRVNLRTLVTKVPKRPAVGNLFETFRLGRLDRQETQWFLGLYSLSHYLRVLYSFGF